MIQLQSIILVLLYGSIFHYSLSQEHWESLVLENDEWAYLIGDSEPPANWYSSSFNDSGWTKAHGSFGYGDNDDSTILNISYSLYIRRTFEIYDTSILSQIKFDIDYDDACVAYLNDSLIYISNNLNTTIPAFDNGANYDHEAQLYGGGSPDRTEISKSLLKKGINTLSIQGINVNTTSSDFSLRPFLICLVNSNEQIYSPVPEYISPTVFEFDSNLPLICINTNGQSVPDEPKIEAHLGIINNASGINNINDAFTDYDGLIAIEIRGQSSLGFAKKSYGFETRTDSGTNNNVSLLGLPKENDWVLYGPYSDKSLIRNILAYHFFKEMGHYSPRTKLCELYLNDRYRGVYVLTETIKRDDDRVDIAELDINDNAGDSLTGGYIIRIDKGNDPSWTSPYSSNLNLPIVIKYLYPQYEDMTTQQRTYIRNYVTEFENVLNGSNILDPYNNYKQYIDIKSFIDYFIVNEISNNVDAYRISTYLFKDKNENNRLKPLKAGPVWDFNIAFGNVNYDNAYLANGWITKSYEVSIPRWWQIMFDDDPEFFYYLVNAWNSYRNTIFSEDRIEEVIDSLTGLLEDAQIRNFNTFPILSHYIWPNYYIGNTYENEINYLKNWIYNRIDWMDEQLVADPAYISNIDNESDWQVNVYPNPVIDHLNVSISGEYSNYISQLTITNILGQVIYMQEDYSSSAHHTIKINSDIINKVMTESGTHILNLKIDGKNIGSKIIIRQKYW